MDDRLDRIADAVLYEGHVLWPYRRSALKNQQRWTFGGIYPATYAAVNGDRSRAGCSVLLEEGGELEVEVRFLQIVHRQVLDDGHPVDELTLDGERHLTWDEAREHRLGPGSFDLAAGSEEEPPYRRSWQRLEGEISLSRRLLHDGVEQISVTIENTSDFPGTARADAMRFTLASAHAVLRARTGAFVSATDPPAAFAAEAAACENAGLWPVLVGEEGDRTTMLASPIILSDYPQVAPESPGDFFDGAEIDQLLVLNILGLTERERDEMRASDPRSRELLDRTEAMSEDELLRLHGTLRDLRPLRETR